MSAVDGAAIIFLPTVVLAVLYKVMIHRGEIPWIGGAAFAYFLTGLIGIDGPLLVQASTLLLDVFEPFLIIWLLHVYWRVGSRLDLAKAALFYSLTAVLVTTVFTGVALLSDIQFSHESTPLAIEAAAQRALSHLGGYLAVAPLFLCLLSNARRFLLEQASRQFGQVVACFILMIIIILFALFAPSLASSSAVKAAAPWTLVLLLPGLIYTCYRAGFVLTFLMIGVGTLMIACLTSMELGSLADIPPNQLRLNLTMGALSAMMILGYVQLLRMALVEAEQAIQAKNKFLASMGHELRSSLTGVVGAAELLQSEMPEDADANDRLGLIRRTGVLMNRLIEDAVGYSQIGDRAIELETVDFSLADVARDSAQLIKERLSRKGVSLVVETDAFEEVPIHADRSRIQQVIINLLSNAAKFTHDGEVRLTLRATPIVNSQILCEVEVADTGPGVSLEERTRVFDAFVRSTPSEGGGLGLGLAISRDIAQAMSGDITITDNHPTGAVFTFKFVANLATASPLETVTRATVDKISQHNVLVADDSEANRLILDAMLTAAGLRVTSVEDGAEALDAFGKAQFDLVLLDMHMPKMNGKATLLEIHKQTSGCPSTPVLIVSGDEDPGVRNELLECGAAGIVAKPYTAEELLGAVNDALTKREAFLMNQIDPVKPNT